jgi:hypothetical protein
LRVGFNLIGLAMFLLAIGAGVWLARALGSSSQALVMLFGGALLAVLDLVVRSLRGVSLLRGAGGGKMLFLPIWIWGVVWTVLGVIDYVHGT